MTIANRLRWFWSVVVMCFWVAIIPVVLLADLICWPRHLWRRKTKAPLVLHEDAYTVAAYGYYLAMRDDRETE